MPVFKHEKIDDIEDVTILVMKNISMRHGKFGDAVHVCLSEEEKTKSDVMVSMNKNSDLCWSTATSHIDVLIDFPNVTLLDQFIESLINLREDHYGPKNK